MENKQDIGKAFREKLDQLNHTPPDAVWDAVYADLHPKRKRRATWLWLPVGLLLIGLAVFLGRSYIVDGKQFYPANRAVNDRAAGTKNPDDHNGNGGNETVFEEKEDTNAKVLQKKIK